eukprot:Opistho-2@41252
MAVDASELLAHIPINFSDQQLWIAVGCVIFNPLMWNIVARREHHTRFLTHLCFGSKYAACYLLAACIFSLGLFRDNQFGLAILSQPKLAELDTPVIKYCGGGLIGLGMLFVVSSTWSLGITGTFLGDYCGILMDARVTGFPFNVLDNPMYWGSTMAFVGASLWHASPAGLFISAVVALVYQVALAFEGPFTAEIYRQRDLKRTKKSK